MTFNPENPGIDLLVIVPAMIVFAAGLLLWKRLGHPAVWVMIAVLPGLALVVLTLAHEGSMDVDGLAHLPVGWVIWTMLSAPGLLLGFLLLLALHMIRRRRTGSDS